MLRFDPRTQKATLVGDELPGHWKWVGGVLAADGNIYGIPCNATQVLCFDPRTQQATLVGDQLLLRRKRHSHGPCHGQKPPTLSDCFVLALLSLISFAVT